MKKTSLVVLTLWISVISSTHLFAQKSVDKYFVYHFVQLPSHPLSNTKYDYVVYQNGEGVEAEVDSASIKEYEVLKRAYETEIKYYYDRLFEIDQQLYEIGGSEDLSLMKKQI